MRNPLGDEIPTCPVCGREADTIMIDLSRLDKLDALEAALWQARHEIEILDRTSDKVRALAQIDAALAGRAIRLGGS